ncbi:MAG: tetratricopeptide repeat protein [Vicinamibacterales bacterium]
MAKQARRPSSPAQPRRARPGTTSPSDSAPQAQLSGSSPGLPPGQSTYAEAVATYEGAIRALQQHDYGEAARLFRRISERHGDERELVERARTYLVLCERQLSPPPAEPATVADQLYAATLALNAGETDRALRLLDAVRASEPGNDQALYMTGIAHVHRGEPQVAIPYLRQAIALNPENRSQARLDPDLEALRDAGDLAPLLHPTDEIGGGTGNGPAGPA